MIYLYTDGACSGNPGPGGWAYLILGNNTIEEKSGAAPHTTNNRMEMCAVIEGLKSVYTSCGDVRLTVCSDSQYVVRGITEWILIWQKNGWKTSQKKPVENNDLWRILWDKTQQFSHVSWQWVKAHADNIHNNRVDMMARTALRSF